MKLLLKIKSYGVSFLSHISRTEEVEIGPQKERRNAEQGTQKWWTGFLSTSHSEALHITN